MKKCLLFGMCALLAASGGEAARLQLSGGMDARWKIRSKQDDFFGVEGLFLNGRKVFSDQKGDRVFVVAQMDADENFDKIRPYQTYLHYKGPLGKWNFLAGHFILPFGLLSDYDTERLLLQTHELKTLGIKLDTGLKFFGRFGNFDYTISGTQGTGRNRLADVDGNKLIITRIGWEGNDWKAGISALNGRVLVDDGNRTTIYQKWVGPDFTWYSGPSTLRAEWGLGKQGSQSAYAGYFGLDRAFSTKLELNLKYSFLTVQSTEHSLGVGLSYNCWQRLFVRAANETRFGENDENTTFLQVYWDFLKTL